MKRLFLTCDVCGARFELELQWGGELTDLLQQRFYSVLIEEAEAQEWTRRDAGASHACPRCRTSGNRTALLPSTREP